MLQLKRNLSSSMALFLSLAILVISIVILECPLLQFTNGVFVYPYDEGYVRMTIAKNIAFHHYWGLSNNAFASASSSILYPILLAIFYKLFGVHTVIPFIFNLICALFFIFFLQRWLDRRGVNGWRQLVVLCIIIAVVPLPLIVCTGMEHTLQLLLSFLFVFGVCDWLDGAETTGIQKKRMPWLLYCYGFLVVATRYEGLFLVVLVAIYLFIRRKPFTAIILSVISCLPIVAFGIYSIRQGAYFIPSSILLKAFPIPLNMHSIWDLAKNTALDRLLYPYPSRGAVAVNRLLILLPLTYLTYLPFVYRQRLYQGLLFSWTGVCILHAAFSSVLFFYRYEAYLFGCSLVVPLLLILKQGSNIVLRKRPLAWIMIGWVALYSFYPFFSRSWNNYEEWREGTRYAYERNWQAAEFLSSYYYKDCVLVDDVGALSYLSDGKRMLFTNGISDMDVLRSIEGRYNRMEYLEYLVGEQKPIIAVISDQKYSGSILQHWVKVASWETPHHLALSDSELCFYAIDKTKAGELKRQLHLFEALLPKEVAVRYY